MKLGLRLPQRLGVDLQHDLVEAARTAEAAGYASLWTYERLLFPETPVEPYAGTNVPWPEHSRQAADPLAVLTAAAVATEKVRLGTSVLVAALHTPVQLAKALATIDQISGGRMIAGMGTGWATDELQATGATRADRGRFLDEMLDVIPVSHARLAHEQIPGSRLEIFEESGHVPHDDHPDRFVKIVEQFIDSTEPFAYDPDLLRAALQTGVRQYGNDEPNEHESDLA